MIRFLSVVKISYRPQTRILRSHDFAGEVPTTLDQEDRTWPDGLLARLQASPAWKADFFLLQLVEVQVEEVQEISLKKIGKINQLINEHFAGKMI